MRNVDRQSVSALPHLRIPGPAGPLAGQHACLQSDELSDNRAEPPGIFLDVQGRYRRSHQQLCSDSGHDDLRVMSRPILASPVRVTAGHRRGIRRLPQPPPALTDCGIHRNDPTKFKLPASNNVTFRLKTCTVPKLDIDP